MGNLYPTSFDAHTARRSFFRWYQTLSPGLSPLTLKMPWVTFGAIGFLEQSLHPKMRVYEYGSGGSTLFLAERVQEVVSVEHDPVWLRKVKAVLQTHNYQSVHLHLIEADKDKPFLAEKVADPDACMSEFASASFQTYVTHINLYPDAHFDVILIDGRARPSCLKQALPKVRVGGFIILDDADRARYQQAMQLVPASAFEFLDFPGPSVGNTYFTRTVIWRRRE